MSVLRLVVVLLVLAVAGCTEKGPAVTEPSDPEPRGNGEEPPPGNDTIPVPEQPRSAEFVDCTALVSAYHVDPVTVGMALPEGYSPRGFVGLGPEAVINLEYYDCKAIILDNTTVLHNVSQAMVVAFVSVPGEVDSPGSVDVFLFEWMTDNPEFQAHAAGYGAPIALADIEVGITGDTDGEASVSVDGQTWYKTTTAADGGDEFDSFTGSRKHHYMDDKTPAWMFGNETAFHQENLVRGAVTEIHDGFLSTFPWASAGHLTGYAQYNLDSGYYDFGKLENP